LGLFGKRPGTARRNYSAFVEQGIEPGQRRDLVGGGLLRICGGWAGVKSLKEAGEYQKGDERILGDGAFVSEVLSRAEEELTKEYRIMAKGFDLNRLIQRVAEIIGLRTEEILDGIGERKRVEARSILSYWATDQLGITQSQLAEKLHMSQSAISHAVRRGKSLVKNNSYSIFEEEFS
jgi:putative transposase